VVSREGGLEGDDALGASPGVVETREGEHALDVRAVGHARLGVRVVAVVRLVGQADAALLDKDEVALGIARVVVDEQLHEARDAAALEAAEGAQQGIHRIDRVDLGKQGG
jgi:hypothetical protein